MARWKLMAAHYINVEGTQWEYSETSRKTGKQVRVKMDVPAYLDPRDPSDCNYQWGRDDDKDGEIIVAREGTAHEPRDITFKGDPTPDMLPLDDEAKAISASFEERWKYKPEIETQNFSQSLVDKFQMEMAEVKTKPAQVEGMAELVSSIAEMAKSNQELIKSLLTRRV